MKPMESFIGQPVRSLQTMLRVIAESDDLQPSIVPDGIYGRQTMTAVSTFQRRHGIPVTGVTDQNTWEQIVAVFGPALIEVGPAEPLELILEPRQVIRSGQSDPAVYLVQAVLATLSKAYRSIPAPSMSGILDIPTADALSQFQAMNALPVTGNLDRQTWRQMALQYPMALIQMRK